MDNTLYCVLILTECIAGPDWRSSLPVQDRRLLKKAIRQFEKAVKIAEKKGMKYQRAKCLLDLAAVKGAGREENRTEAIGLLKEMKSVMPRAESWLLGDQYEEAVVAPEFDLEAWEREHGSVSATTQNEYSGCRGFC